MMQLRKPSVLLAVAAPLLLPLFNLADAILHQRRTLGNIPPRPTDDDDRSLALDRAEASLELEYAGVGETPGESGAMLRNYTWVQGEERYFHAKPDRSEGGDTERSAALNNVLPIKWLHIPKTGSSFINTLINVPGVCPGIPDDLYVSKATFGDQFLKELNKKYEIKKICPRLDRTTADPALGGFGHVGLGNASQYFWDSVINERKTLFTFMRQPEQRIISAYNDMTNARRSGTYVGDAASKSWAWPGLKAPFSLREYAKGTGGCAVRMMTRGGYSCGGPEPATRAELQVAKKRLNKDFAFVGITEEWKLSMCLFSKMFETKCHSVQFEDTRPGVYAHHATDSYSLWRLGGYRDHLDGELYEEAKKIFRENVKRYDASQAGCQKCYSEAGLIVAASPAAKQHASSPPGREHA